jgi:hypothetical protein
VIGGIASLAQFAKTVYEILKLTKSSGKSDIVVRIKGPNQRMVTIKASDSRSAKDVIKTLEQLN